MGDQTTPQMNFAGLQERIVPLMAELFATLASQNPLRMYFADVAGKTLLDIVEVLRSDGVSQEAIAASFDLTMNGYRAKMRRLHELHREGAEVIGDEPRTLFERIHAFVEAGTRDSGWMKLTRVIDEFRGIKPDTVKGAIQFLVRSGLVETEGRGATRTCRVVSRPRGREATVQDAAVMLYREGPLELTELARRLCLSESTAAEYLEALRAEGTLRTHEGVRFSVDDYHVRLDTVEGYEAAIFDHLAAVVHAISKKLRVGRHAATLQELTGGATFTFHVPVEDPLWEEVSGFLRDNRVRLEDWLQRARALKEAGLEGRDTKRVTIYVGQSVDDLET